MADCCDCRYRKRFTLPPSARGQAISLEFDGVMISSQVYLNGRFLGNHSSGYTPFRFNLSGADLRFGPGGTNLLAVRADATLASDQWLNAWYATCLVNTGCTGLYYADIAVNCEWL